MVRIWEVYPLKKDYTWDPIENLYDKEELVETYEKWLNEDNERLEKSKKFRKDDTLSKKDKGNQSISKEHSTSTWQMMRQIQDMTHDGHNFDGVIGAEGVDT